MDKSTYWVNRKASKRGQGDYPNLVVGYHLFPDWPKKLASKKSRKRLLNTK